MENITEKNSQFRKFLSEIDKKYQAYFKELETNSITSYFTTVNGYKLRYIPANKFAWSLFVG